jgi:hypothetical protein
MNLATIIRNAKEGDAIACRLRMTAMKGQKKNILLLRERLARETHLL